jgi:hypothetical protein
LSGPLALKSFVCGAKLGDDEQDGGFVYKLFDGSSEIYRIHDCLNTSGGDQFSIANARFNIFFPLSGLRVSESLRISIEGFGNTSGLQAVGISILYRR